MKVEIVLSANAIQEVAWLRRFLYHLGIVTSTNELVTIRSQLLAQKITNIPTKPNAYTSV